MTSDFAQGQACSINAPSQPGRPARLVVLVSGGGSNLQSLLAACEQEEYGAQVVAIGADRPCGALDIAAEKQIPGFACVLKEYPARELWDQALAENIAAHDPDLIVSAGFLKLLGESVRTRWPGRIINTHNALLPAFPGIHGPRDALAYGVKLAGATLFFVDAGEDTGQIIAQVAVPVLPDDNEDSLTERIKVAERAQLVDCVGRLVRGGWRIEGRQVSIG